MADRAVMDNGSVETVTIFLSGNTLSTLKPCGCAEGQLGGFEGRSALIGRVPPENRVIIDTGNFLYEQNRQDLIKFGVMFQALSMLDYDLVALNQDDFDAAAQLELLSGTNTFDIITSAEQDIEIPLRWSKEIQLTGRCFHVNVAVVNAETKQMGQVEELFDFPDENGSQALNILIIDNCQPDTIDFIQHIQTVDVVICPGPADEPRILSEPKAKPLLVTVGNRGKYLGKLTAAVSPHKPVRLEYNKISVDEKLPQDASLKQLYKDYQFIVKSENLLEKVDKVPLPDELEYLGSTSCNLAPCHQYEYKKWSTKAHAQAYKTLVDVGSQYDPECIVCHVVGLEYETGFVNEDSPNDLRDVGCEACHGPGSKHMIAVTMDESDKKTTEPKLQCIDCHTPEHSPKFETHEEEYREKIIHWREHKDISTVQQGSN